jgi:hypothetical protein
VIKAEQDLPGIEEEAGRGSEGVEMTQTMYSHVNKRLKKS